MAKTSDARISAEQLCQLLGVAHQTRQQWQKRGWVAPIPNGARLVETLELAAFVAINHALRPRNVAIAWPQVQPELKTRIPGEEIDVVFDMQIRRATVASSLEELADYVRVGHPVHVVRLGPPLRQARDAFALLASPPPTPYQPETKDVSPIRSTEDEAG
jgi:hypothetical protein